MGPRWVIVLAEALVAVKRVRAIHSLVHFQLVGACFFSKMKFSKFPAIIVAIFMLNSDENLPDLRDNFKKWKASWTFFLFLFLFSFFSARRVER